MEQTNQFEQWRQMALDCGFTSAWPLDAGKLTFLPEVRAMCAEDKCRQYNRNWTCPPACGTIEEAAARAAGFRRGILLLTVGRLEDCFDAEGVDAAIKQHQDSFGRLMVRLRETYPNLFALGMGACTRCERCTYPDEPCRFPELAAPSMEAYGLLVSKVCRDHDAPYYSGPDTVTFSSCMLID